MPVQVVLGQVEQHRGLGANASVSSSWNDDASHTTTAPGSSVPGSDVSAVPTLPATITGSPAARWMWPISSTVVVLPLEP